MKYLYLFLLALTSCAADAADPGSQYQQQAEAGDPRAQFYLADTWVSSGNYQQAEYWAQKAAAQGDGDAMALLAQLKIRNPQQADYQQARQLAEKSVRGRQQGWRDYPRPRAGQSVRLAPTDVCARHQAAAGCGQG